MKIIGVVTTYFPDLKKLQANISTYLEQLDELLIWENTPPEKSRVAAFFEGQKKIIVCTTGENKGIAKALNTAAQWAIDHDYEYVLTMDQDSSFSPGDFPKYLDIISQNDQTDIGLWTPAYKNTGTSELLKKEITMTSGSVIKTSVIQDCGFFLEELFIDLVDSEYCFRIRNKHYWIIQVSPIVLNHQLGYKKVNKLGITTINYSALRTYYIVRNWFLVYDRYPHQLLATCGPKSKFYKYTLFYRFVKIILFENHKIAKLKALLLGIYHGLSGKSGVVYH